MIEGIPSQEELDALCLDWQKRLRLMDWKIVAKIVPQEDIPENNGQVNLWQLDKTAVIRIADMAEIAQGIMSRNFPDTFERILVHELLEIHLDVFAPKREDDELKFNAKELAINLITDALVESKHGNGNRIEEELRAEKVR